MVLVKVPRIVLEKKKKVRKRARSKARVKKRMCKRYGGKKRR